MPSRYDPDPDAYPDVPPEELKEAVRRLCILDAPDNATLRLPGDDTRKIKRWRDLHLRLGLRGLLARRKYRYARRPGHDKPGRPRNDDSIQRVKRMAIRTTWGGVKLARALGMSRGTVDTYLRHLGLATKKDRIVARRKPSNASYLMEW